MSYFIVKRCAYCGTDFTEWHECAGTEREKRRVIKQETPTKDQQMLEKLEELLNSQSR